MEKEIVGKNQLISSMIRIGHGKFDIFKETGLRAATEEPELFAHFISWNTMKGKVTDSKVAFPVCALRHNVDYAENAVANLCRLDPRNLMKAIDFNQKLTADGYPVNSGAGTILKKGVRLYLGVRGERAMLQHRKSMRNLYKAFRIRPTKYAQQILFRSGYKATHNSKKIAFDSRYPEDSVFDAVAKLKDMSPKMAAGTILNKKIPTLISVGALGGIKNKPEIILALIEQMSGNELMNWTNSLTEMGVFENPALSAAYDAAVERAKKDKKTTTLKAGSFKTKSKKAAKKLKGLKDEKLSQLGGIDGDWLVLADKSQSMHESIEIAKEVASLIVQQVKGNVYLIFFNANPQFVNVTGLDLDSIKEKTKGVRSGGMTSIGVGVDYILKRQLLVNGIVLISDGGENTRPTFDETCMKYADKMGIEPTIYHIRVKGHPDRLVGMKTMVEKLHFGKDVDYYSLPNLVLSLKANRYQFLDEIMETPLLTFNDVFERRTK